MSTFYLFLLLLVPLLRKAISILFRQAEHDSLTFRRDDSPLAGILWIGGGNPGGHETSKT